MGTWGVGSFDNDEADMLLGFLEEQGHGYLAFALDVVAQSKSHTGEELSDCVYGIAAAELVAAMDGHPSNEFPDSYRAWMQQAEPASSNELRALAIFAVERVLKRSELRKQWTRASRLAEWEHDVNDLLHRLHEQPASPQLEVPPSEQPAGDLKVIAAPTRKQMKPGDVFAYELGEPAVFGYGALARNITDPYYEEFVLVYVYRAFSRQVVDFDGLPPERLLLPPTMVDMTLWSEGLCRVVGRLEERMILPRHCFYCDIENGYFDEHGRRWKKKAEPCGDRSATTMWGIGARVSAALDSEVLQASWID